ncbi:PLP-dependent transferase [Nostocoides sp. F2B08]|uniref:trans-sulfuration enzyme family protein n=1 Tax=Nostocoides sp. F2B08 TaxID=2653936 RepID=UPI001263B1A5|nr:aminotransferase class I/II-fold pyridoxal phosphate-dependent enzyme [Tetrasphaera sp. F2B08]KAB7743869.1 PLP-dependent transferase [Tetrasphaera sp. F2B08]
MSVTPTSHPVPSAPLAPIDTRAVHAGREDLTDLGVHALPIDLSTTSPLPGVEAGGDAYERLAGGAPPLPGQTPVYARLWNGTVARFESGLAALEGAEAAVAFASGMAAMSAVLLALPPDRRHVVAVRPLYGGTDHLLTTGLLGTTVTYASVEDVPSALTDATGLVVLETPANPTLELVDIRAVVDAIAATGREVPLLVDNTFATPVLQNPLAHGASLVLHSATKFIGGHGDALGGVVATDEATAERIRPVRAITGGILHPWAAYLLHRGLATLPVRVRAQQASATAVAAALRSHPAVARVWHPSLPECDPQGLIGRQQSGPGAILAFELSGGFGSAAAVAEHVELITHAVSLGGVDSLIQHPAALTHRPCPPDARPGAGILRLSVGLEDAGDILGDLEKALASA